MNRKIKLSVIVIFVLSFGQLDLYGQTSIENEGKITQPKHEGKLHLHLSFPLINSFRIRLENEGNKTNTGLTGITLGLDYYYSPKQFVHFGASTATSAQFRNAKYGRISSTYLSFSNNHKIKNFTIGYGLSWATENSWKYGQWKELNFHEPLEIIKESHSAFGLILPTYFSTGKYSNIGIVYRPTFFRPTLTNKFGYEHLISIDLAWKIGS